jgi:hypothetical protein
MAAADPDTLFDFADQLALVSSEVLRFRIRNKAALGPDEKAALEDLEMQLDQATASVRAQGIAALGAVTEADRLEIEAATEQAEALLRRIRKAERALEIAKSVLGLALAAIDGQPKGILVALKTVKDTVAGDRPDRADPEERRVA